MPPVHPRYSPEHRQSETRDRVGNETISARARLRHLFMTFLWLVPVALPSPLEPTWAAGPSSAQTPPSIATLSGQELLRIGEIHDDQQHFLETLTYYQLALSKFRETKQPRGAAMAGPHIGLEI